MQVFLWTWAKKIQTVTDQNCNANNLMQITMPAAAIMGFEILLVDVVPFVLNKVEWKIDCRILSSSKDFTPLKTLQFFNFEAVVRNPRHVHFNYPINIYLFSYLFIIIIIVIILKFFIIIIISIIQQLPKSISKRLSNVSSSKEIFGSATHTYQATLTLSSYNKKTPTSFDKESKRKRKRKMLWICPPYSNNEKGNVGKFFFKIMRKHFPRNHTLYKIFYKNTLKIS